MRAAVYAATEPTLHERGLAALSIALLRDGGVCDAEILRDYTQDHPQADRAYERLYWEENRVRISAHRVKLQMRRLVNN